MTASNRAGMPPYCVSSSGSFQGGDMWCDHCKEEIVPLAGEEKGDIQKCHQCGNLLSAEQNRASGTLQGSPSATSSIAQTAHALLKRWEESRPVATSSAVDGNSATTATATTATAAIAAEQVKSTAPVKTASKSEFENKTVSQETPTPVQSKQEPVNATASPSSPASPGEDVFNDIPSGLDVSEMLPDLVPPMRTASVPSDASKKQRTEPAQTAMKAEAEISREEKENVEAAPAPSPLSRSVGSPKSSEQKSPEKKQPKRTYQPGKTLASQNDAGALLNRERKPISQQNKKSDSSQSSIQPGAVASPATESERPEMFKTRTTDQTEATIETKAESRLSTRQKEINKGRVRFTTQETPEEKIDDLGIQQAIERHYRQRRNWSVLFAQLLVYGGALAMTSGVAIVIGSRFGSLEIAETTGWLSAVGGHLLFVLGIYTHLSSKLEQVWSEMHARQDELTRLLSQKMNKANPRKTNLQSSDAQETTFQRSSLSDTVRKVA